MVLDAVWWPIVIGVPIMAVATFVDGVIRIDTMREMMSGRHTPPRPPP
jgi:hypothetical protein